MKQLRTYQLAVKFYQQCKKISLKGELKDQLLRASSSIVLNLAEGTGRRTIPDQKRFYQISFGSIRECQAIIDLNSEEFTPEMIDLLDHMAAATYKLLNCSS